MEIKNKSFTVDIQSWCVLKSWENEKKKIWIEIKAMGVMLQGYDWKEWDNEYILGNYLREQSSIIYVCQDKSNPQHRN